MDIQHLFVSSFRVWFGFLLSLNIIGIFFINLLEQESQAYQFGFAGIVSNLIVAYLILLYNHFQINQEKKEEPFYDPEKPFSQWIWFTDNQCHRTIMGIVFFIWLIPNFLLIGKMSGVTWLIGLHFVVSLIYWFWVLGSMCYSNAHDVSSIDRV